MKIRELLEDKYYTGYPLEVGGTSTGFGGAAAPSLRDLVGTVIKPGMKVLDYGAGKHSRNANYLRDKGIDTFAYDPFNSNIDPAESQKQGWEKNKVAASVSLKDNDNSKFDVGLTSFVLNVVPKNIEEDIVKKLEKLSKTQIHIVRNKDVFVAAKNSLLRKDDVVYPFFVKEFNKGKEVDPKDLTDDVIKDFCRFGFETSRGFQRIPELEQYGYELIRETSNFKVYKR